ncbi:MAG: hypothetical protein JXQ75_20845 [Phycisphaerae bacterium]|nr:hypothetical protein [Phycisphaerae bacterium]
MRPRCGTVCTVVFVGLVLGTTPRVWAQFGSLQRFLFRGAEYAGNNLFLSNPQGGPLYDHNRFDQRVEYNRAGQGYTYESYRFYGPDSYGNTNTLDLGLFKVELGVDPTVVGSPQPMGVHSRAGYTTTFIPEVFIESQTGQRGYNQLSGLTTFSAAPMHYTVTFNAGVQDFEWSGNALIDMNGRMNLLGFYDFELRFTNVGSYEADGLFVHDEQVTDFDIGPINVSGNIALDVLAGLLQTDGASTDAAVPRIYSGAAQKGKTVDDLLAELKAGETLSEEEIQFLAQQMFTTAFVADPLGVLTNGLPAEVPGFEGFSLEMTASAEEADGGYTGSAVPEPGVLGFLMTAAGLSAAVRRFGKRRT